MLHDLRFALRAVRRSPGFTAVAALSLALGIGANTAIFSLVNALMLRMLPVPESGQLVQLMSRYPGEPRIGAFNWKAYEHFRDENHVLSDLMAFSPARFQVSQEGRDPEGVDGQYVSGNFFPGLGLQPAAGRLISQEDDRLGSVGAAVAVVSWSCWQTRFSSDPRLVGRRILVNDVPAVVIGVTPLGFSGVLLDSPQDIWVPAAMEPLVRQPSARASGAMGVGLIGRLRTGVSLDRALSEMTVLNRWRVEETARASHDPLWRQATIELAPAGAGVSPAREYVGGPLLALMATVALLLVLSCANVAGMLLARAAGRRREIAVRVSLGAGRARLLRLVLIESLMLSALASVLGLAIAWAGSAALVRIVASGRPLPGMGPLLLRPSLDAHVLLFTAVTAVTTALLFGVAPAWHAFSVSPMSSLREASVVGDSGPRRRFAKALVVAQVALSIVVLSLAALFLRHLSDLRSVDVGFDRNSVLLVSLDPARSGLQGRQLLNAYGDLVSRFAAMPGVRAVTVAAVTPIQGAAASRFVKVEGFEDPPDRRRRVALNWIGSGYSATFGTPIVAGRDFGAADAGGPRAALMNEAMVRYYFGGRDPIGGRFTFEGQDDPYTVVGVVADAKYSDLHEPVPRTVYLSAFQDARVTPRHLALRTSVSPLALAPDVRRIVQDTVKGVRIEKVTTLFDQVDASIVPERLLAMLASVFAAAAALLAAIGLYGLLAYSVTRRVSEIGVRRALGATEWDIVRMVLGSALGLVAAGVLAGAPLAFWGRRLTLALVGDLPRGVVWQTLAAASVMLIVALLAACVPARRAARVNPADALRRS